MEKEGLLQRLISVLLILVAHRYLKGIMLGVISYELLKQELIIDEGELPYPYDDKTGKRINALPTGGKITIGIGRNLFAKPLSQAVIDLMLREDINEALNICLSLFPEFEDFSQKRKHALINMAFNLGFEGLRNFKKMKAAINSGDWHTAAIEATGTLK